MTVHTIEALIFSDQCTKDYLVHFQSWNITAALIIMSKTIK